MLSGVVDFKILKIKLSVKTLNKKRKALKDIEKDLSNKDAFKNYGVSPDTISTWIKNKENYFKALEDNCSSKKRRFRESDFEKVDNVMVLLDGLTDEKKLNDQQLCLYGDM